MTKPEKHGFAKVPPTAMRLTPSRLRRIGRYGVIYIDPPWRFQTWGDPEENEKGAEQHYDTMSIEDMKRLPIANVAADDAAMFIWVYDAMHPEAHELIAHFGFRYITVAFYWVKRNASGAFPVGTGYWTRGNPEQCWLATKGSPKRLSRGVQKLIIAPPGEHSEKPDEARRRIEQLCGGPMLEMFTRKRAGGWELWGNEVGKLGGTGGIVVDLPGYPSTVVEPDQIDMSALLTDPALAGGG